MRRKCDGSRLIAVVLRDGVVCGWTLRVAHSHCEIKRHQSPGQPQLDGVCTNWAEDFLSCMREAEIGHHHHLAGA